MRFDIMKFDRVIGHINFDDMTTPLMKSLFKLGYIIKLSSTGDTNEQ